MLISFAGLPGTGKTTIARTLAKEIEAVYLRIDSIEQPMLRAGWQVDGWGYAVAHAVAGDNLRLGRTVISDCVNDWALTRDEWKSVALRAGVPCFEVEVTCSDRAEHRRRVETRVSDIPGLDVPSWDAVVGRDYHPWNRDRLVIDTAGADVETCVAKLRTALAAQFASTRTSS